MKKKIPEYEDYKADKLGNIYGKDGRKMISRKHNKGYQQFTLSVNGIKKGHYGHRLIAKAFLPNPQNKPCVNHLNHNRQDNRVKNLVWATYTENILHDYRDGTRDRVRQRVKDVCSKLVIDMATGVFYDSIADAGKFSRYNPRTIGMMLNGVRTNKTTLQFC